MASERALCNKPIGFSEALMVHCLRNEGHKGECRPSYDVASERERVIIDLCDRYAADEINSQDELVGHAFDAGRKAGLEDAAKVAEKEIGATRHEIAAAIRALIGEKS